MIREKESLLSIIREEVAGLEYSGITRIALEGLDDPDVVPLWFGESDLETPSFVSEAAKLALDNGKTKYSYARGHLPLREALKIYLDRLYKTDINPDRITVPGSTMLGVMMAAQSILRPGDEIIVVTPHWPNIGTVIKMIGAVQKFVRLEQCGDHWYLDIEKVKAAAGPRTKAIYINSPSNPTGWVMSGSEQKVILDFCREKSIGIIADEVYHRNLFDDLIIAPSFTEITEENDPVFIINGFSKAWAMTGWRLGWFLAPANLAEQMAVFSECANTGATAFVQYGGIAALEQGEDFLASFRERCRTNRDLVMSIIGKHPRVELLEPKGAFYAFPKINATGDGLAIARGLLRSEKVGVAAGYTFGPGNEQHIRLCYAISPDRLEPALHKIASFLDRNDI
jgi:aspartate/methionine/tyrosine aminotransferase